MPTLDEVKAKDQTTLTEEDKQVIVDNAASLSQEEKIKYGLEAAPVAPVVKTEVEPIVPAPVVTVDPELASIAASVKSGDSVVIKASVYKDLTDSVEQYQTEKATAIVASHIDRGAIKPDAEAFWVNQLVGVRADAAGRKALEDQLAALNGNKVVMAGELGSSTKASDVTNAQAQLMEKAHAAVKADATGKTTLTEAMRAVMASDRGLADQVNNERAAAQASHR